MTSVEVTLKNCDDEADPEQCYIDRQQRVITLQCQGIEDTNKQ